MDSARIWQRWLPHVMRRYRRDPASGPSDRLSPTIEAAREPGAAYRFVDTHFPETRVTRTAIRPYLILKDEDGAFRITVRTTRFNSQGYPLVTANRLEGGFETLFKARAHVREQFRAEATDIATK